MSRTFAFDVHLDFKIVTSFQAYSKNLIRFNHLDETSRLRQGNHFYIYCKQYAVISTKRSAWRNLILLTQKFSQNILTDITFVDIGIDIAVFL